MSTHLGDFDASAVLYGKFTTFRPSTGAAYTLAGTPAVSVYKDGSTTESTSGVSLTADFDARTGLNHFAIDTSTDGTFYSAGSFFSVVITAGTVDSVSVVGAVVAGFTIRKNSSLKPTTAGRTLVVDASGLGDANTVKLGPTGAGAAQAARDIGTSVLLSAGTGTGQLDFTSGVVKSNLAQILGTALTETAGLLAGGFKKFFNVSSPTLTCLGVDQTGDSYARIGAGGASLTAIGDTRMANLDATVSSRLAPAGTLAVCTLVTTTTNSTNAPTAGDFTSTMKTSLNAATPASVVGAVGSVTGNVGGNVTGTVGSVVGAVGSVTGNVGGNVTGSVGSVAGAVGSVTGNVGGNIAGSVGSLATQAKTDVENATWNTVLASHLTSGSTGAALNAAGAAGDPWSTAIPGAYGAGTAGLIVGTNLNATVSSRSTYAGTDTSGTTTLLSRIPGTVQPQTGDSYARLGAPAGASVSADIAQVESNVVAVPTAIQNADAFLKRDWTSVTGEAARSALNAMRTLRNKVTVGSTTLTVYKEDGSTTAFTETVTKDAAADPIVGVTPS